MLLSKWHRVTRQCPCEICRKPDWCTYTDTGYCCMRIQNNKPCKNGGWWWPLNGEVKISRPVRQWHPPADGAPDFNALLADWKLTTDQAELCFYASSLGVKCDALKSLGACQRDPHTWAFPMRDGKGEVIGIRLRHDDGKKWCVKGSHQGLFVNDAPSGEIAFVTEGPTDTAAALSLGLWAVGRASCAGPNQELRRLCKARGIQRAVILSDNDDPGINGAERLSHEIGVPCAVIIPPAKDMREFVRCGGTREMIDWMLKETLWRTQP